MLSFTSTLATVDNLNWAEGVLVPPATAQKLLAADRRARFVVTLNGNDPFHCGLIALGDGYMIYLSQERRKRWGIEPGEPVRVEIAPDESEFGYPVPEEWQELTDLDPEVADYFRHLKPGEQRNLLHRIGSPKRPATRVKRAVQIADYLRENRGNFDYVELAAFIKAANQR